MIRKSVVMRRCGMIVSALATNKNCIENNKKVDDMCVKSEFLFV